MASNYAPLELKKKIITGAKDGPRLLIVGGIHGDEFEPMAAIRRLMQAIHPSQLQGQVILLPVANEAAFVCGRRMAYDEMDLARTCPGRPDGSITECTAYAVSQLIRGCDYLIDLHTGGTHYEVSPLAGYTCHEKPYVKATQRRMAEAFNLPLVWGTAPDLQGRTLSVARDHDIPAIYAEWGGGACDQAGVDAYVEGCLNVMAHLDMIERDVPPSKVQYHIEDHGSQSGNLLRDNLSPLTGFFEPCVSLNDQVSEGSVLGIVTDVLGHDDATVVAGHSGTIICLRRFARVFAGDSLAHIVDLHDNTNHNS